MTRTDSVCHKGECLKTCSKSLRRCKTQRGGSRSPVAPLAPQATSTDEPLGVLQSGGVGGDGNHKASNCVRVAPPGRDAPRRVTNRASEAGAELVSYSALSARYLSRKVKMRVQLLKVKAPFKKSCLRKKLT